MLNENKETYIFKVTSPYAKFLCRKHEHPTFKLPLLIVHIKSETFCIFSTVVFEIPSPVIHKSIEKKTRQSSATLRGKGKQTLTTGLLHSSVAIHALKSTKK